MTLHSNDSICCDICWLSEGRQGQIFCLLSFRRRSSAERLHVTVLQLHRLEQYSSWELACLQIISVSSRAWKHKQKILNAFREWLNWAILGQSRGSSTTLSWLKVPELQISCKITADLQRFLFLHTLECVSESAHLQQEPVAQKI